MEKFSSFITEEVKEPYRLLILVYDTPDDPNKTGVLIQKQAKKMGIDCYQFDVAKGYTSINQKGNMVMHNYVFEKDVLGQTTKEEHDKKGWEVTPENTVCLLRVSYDNGMRVTEQLRLHGVKTINSRHTQIISDDKWLNYVAMKIDKIRQPKSALIGHENTVDIPVAEIGGKYPMILKTAKGTHGIGVIFIDSKKTLVATIQLIKKLDETRDMIIQEYIKTSYDVRAMVLENEVIAQLKRPVIDGDFRSNISQGNEPQKIELTELEKQECIKAARSVNAVWVGVDFIPSEDREKIPPYMIEVNSSPGTAGIIEMNDINIFKLVLESFYNRENWR